MFFAITSEDVFMTIETARLNMIKQQLRPCEVLDDHILHILETLPREAFVPEAFKTLAFADTNIPLAHEQIMMTPFEESTLLQVLNIQPHETVLEIGTGSGYMTALLARLARLVISIEYFADFTARAKEKLEKFAISNVELITANGARGYLEKAPYDVIVFTGSLPALPKILRPQLLPGGRIFAILGDVPVMEATLVNSEWQYEKLFETYLPPLLKIKHPAEFVF